MHNETFEVTDEYEEERLDKFLAAIYPEQSRSFFQKLIRMVWYQLMMCRNQKQIIGCI